MLIIGMVQIFIENIIKTIGMSTALQYIRCVKSRCIFFGFLLLLNLANAKVSGKAINYSLYFLVLNTV